MSSFYSSYIKPLWGDLAKWPIMDTMWFIMACVAVVVVSDPNDKVTTLATLANVICVILMAKGRISNWYWGILGAFLMVFVSIKFNQLGLAITNAVFVVFQVMGLLSWSKAMKGTGVADVPIRTLSWDSNVDFTHWVMSLSAVPICSVLLIVYLKTFGVLDSSIFDTLVFALSMSGLYLSYLRYKEQWIFWILSDIVALSLWIPLSINGEGSWSVVAMWVVFLINAIFGFYKWNIVKSGK